MNLVTFKVLSQRSEDWRKVSGNRGRIPNELLDLVKAACAQHTFVLDQKNDRESAKLRNV